MVEDKLNFLKMICSDPELDWLMEWAILSIFVDAGLFYFFYKQHKEKINICQN